MRTPNSLLVYALMLALAGCATPPVVEPDKAPEDAAQPRPQARPETLAVTRRPPPETARTVEEFDTTTIEERAAAADASSGGAGAVLGTTIVSLGDPARPGFWIETPLATAAGSGRVTFVDTGQSAQVDLIPIDGPPTAGSRLSLAAMRLIGAPLTGLVEVQVSSGG